MIELFNPFLEKIKDKDHQNKLKKLLTWISDNYPQLEQAIKWNQPMFTNHGTYIIGLSVSKNHIAISPEQKTLLKFLEAIQATGYDYGKMIVRLPWDKPIDYALIKKFIDYNIEDKKNINTFWRK